MSSCVAHSIPAALPFFTTNPFKWSISDGCFLDKISWYMEDLLCSVGGQILGARYICYGDPEDLEDGATSCGILQQVIDTFPETRHSANATHKLHEWQREDEEKAFMNGPGGNPPA